MYGSDLHLISCKISRNFLLYHQSLVFKFTPYRYHRSLFVFCVYLYVSCTMHTHTYVHTYIRRYDNKCNKFARGAGVPGGNSSVFRNFSCVYDTYTHNFCEKSHTRTITPVYSFWLLNTNTRKVYIPRWCHVGFHACCEMGKKLVTFTYRYSQSRSWVVYIFLDFLTRDCYF